MTEAEVTHAFTCRQPWAHAIAHLGKRLENRTRGPGAAHVGRLVAVHAGATKDVDGYEELAARGLYRVGDRVPIRAVVAVARILAVGDHRDGSVNVLATGDRAIDVPVLEALAGTAWLRLDARKVWILGDVQPIEPVTWAGGALGVWRMPEALRERVEAARRLPPPRWR